MIIALLDWKQLPFSFFIYMLLFEIFAKKNITKISLTYTRPWL